VPTEQSLAGEAFCYITTSGRVTGRPHEIEIWFGMSGPTIYAFRRWRALGLGAEHCEDACGLCANRQPGFRGAARIVLGPEEDALARRLLLEKYSPTYEGDLMDWGRTALPVAIDLVGLPGSEPGP
jgi:hypothetical protein